VLFESWLLLHAADLAEHAATHLGMAVSAVQHEAHVILEEITPALGSSGSAEMGVVNGGCSDTLAN
jgi:hypothetical protein